MRLEHYAKLKNKICILYTGFEENTIDKIKKIPDKYPEISFFFCLNDKFVGILPNSFSDKDLEKNKLNFSIIKEFKSFEEII
jgi:hypothetical protein